MKIKTSSRDLLTSLKKVNSSVSSNPVLPILECVLFEVENGVLNLRATNLETTIETKLKVDSEENFSIAIPSGILFSTLNGLPDQPIEIIVTPETFGVEIKSSVGSYKMSGDKPSDFPNKPELEDENQLTLKSSDLLQGINKTTFACTSDELRVAMTGVLFEFQNNSLIMVATDAHKLSRFTLKDTNFEGEKSLIINKDSLQKMRESLGKSEEVSVSYTDQNIFFEVGDTKFTSRLIDSKYPDYRAVIPAEHDKKLLVNKADLLSSLKRVGIYANSTTNQVILIIEDGKLVIASKDLDFQNEAKEELSCTYEGERIEIAFNYKFMLEVLNAISSENVIINMSNPNRSAILEEEIKVEGLDLLLLLMPVLRQG